MFKFHGLLREKLGPVTQTSIWGPRLTLLILRKLLPAWGRGRLRNGVFPPLQVYRNLQLFMDNKGPGTSSLTG